MGTFYGNRFLRKGSRSSTAKNTTKPIRPLNYQMTSPVVVEFFRTAK